MAEQVLVRQPEKTSREGVAAALLIAQVAWNRAVDPLGGDQIGYYRKILSALKQKNPKCMQDLKSPDYESMIQELMAIKRYSYPADTRIIRLCGLTERNTVRVECHERDVEGAN
jgi:hypothetical protein